jgi:sugar lactone lactonase YvrE
MAIKISGNTVIDNDNNLVNLESATFTGTSYLKLPSGDASTRPESPLNGTIRYNNTSGFLETRSNDNWEILGSFDIRLSGGSQLYANVPNFFLISNYDSRRVYNVSTTNGTISITDDLILYVPEDTGPGGFTVNNRTYSGTVIAGNPPGQAEFTTVGEHEFTVPYGVTKISAVVIGGGGGGADDTTNGACGGNGGNLVYANDIPVTPNELLSVYVGRGGLGSTNGTNGQKGEDSYISRPNEIILGAFGGLGGDVGTIATNQTNDFLYEGINFSVGSQDGNPYDIFFKPDGTKMYVLGGSSDRVYQYTLSTPWDVSTASYDSVNFSVGSQDGSPSSIFFKPDGTKMYMVGTSIDTVYQYTLTEPWVVSTASYDSVSFSVQSQENSPRSIFFKPDGTKMYMVGTLTDRVYQYTLSTPWDVSTASYDSVNFSVGSQDTAPYDIFFKEDGSKMYMLGGAEGRVYQYTLTEPWVVSTASYDSVSFSFESQDGGSFGIFFKDDGSKMHMVGTSTDKVYQYSLVQSASANTVFGLGGTGGAGTSAYDNAGGGGGAAGYGGNGGNGGTYNGTSAAGSDATPNSGGGGGGASTTGTTDVGGGGGGANIYGPVFGNKSENNYNEITLDSYSVNSLDTVPAAIYFRPGGTKMYMIGYSTNRVYQLSLSTAWDVSTASYDGVSFLVSGQATQSRDVYFKPDGTKMYVLAGSTNRVYQYTLSTAWDVSTASYDSISFPGPDSNSRSIFFKPDGTMVYVLGGSVDRVYQYTLSTAWDLSSYSYARLFYVGNQDSVPAGIFFKPDGTEMYMVGTSTDTVYQYNLSIPWNLSTASYDSVSFDVGSQDDNPYSIFFKSDGTKMYMVGVSTDRVYQYSLNSAWDFSTISTYNPSYTYNTGFSDLWDLTFKSDGTKMYLVSSDGDKKIFQYSLSTAWDSTTASYDDISYQVLSNENILEFKPDGTKMYTMNPGSSIRSHTLNTSWDLSTASVDVGSKTLTDDFIDLFFKPDGSSFYFLRAGATNSIFQYNLNTEWDLAEFDSNDPIYFPIPLETDIDKFNFNADGSKIFTFNSNTGEINEYFLLTSWDISTAKYINTYYMGLALNSNESFAFRSDLSRVFFASKVSGFYEIVQIDLFEPEVFYYELGGKGPFSYGLSGSTGAQSGFNGLVDPTRGNGGLYGGGGAAASLQTGRTAGNGARGAVRIIWGDGRSYPSTNVGDV